MKVLRWTIILGTVVGTLFCCRCRVGNYLQQRAWKLLEQPVTRVQQLTFYDRRYAVELRDRYIVTEGDLIIGEVRPENVDKFREIANPTQDTILSLGRIRKTSRSYVWPDGRVPFAFEKDLSEDRQREILKAMKVWQARVALKFKTRTGEADYIFFKNGDSGTGCFSDLGRIGGRQILSLEGGCFDTGVIAHVLGHALGFEHEHTRPDRDAHIQLHEERLDVKYRLQFQRRPSRGLHVADYDAASLMHYGPTAFSDSEQSVYSLRSPGQHKYVRRSTLSGGDYASASSYYGNAWHTFTADVSGDGTADWVEVRKGAGVAGAWTGTEDGFRPRDSYGAAEAVASNYQRSLYLSGDFNGDGRADLMEINRSRRIAFVWKAHGSAFSDKNSFGVVKNLAEESDLAHYVTGDFNGDENDDLLEVNRGQRTTRLWYSTGVEFERSEGTPANDIARLFSNAHFFAADFNGDKHDDLAEVNRKAGVVFVWLGGNRGLYNWGYYGLARNISREQVGVSYMIGDFEGDGRADIMEVNRSFGRGRIWSGGHGGFIDYFRSATGLLPPEAPGIHLLADCNGDGNTDLVEIDRGTRVLRAWLAGPGGFKGPEGYGQGVATAKAGVPARYFAGDFNGDKREDVLEVNIAEGRAYLWPAGDTGFGSKKIWAEFD